jgi:phosphoglycolate phosphatase
MVRLALAELGVESADAALIGDSEVDVATARAAGLAVVLLGYGYVRGPLAGAGADATAEDFGGLADALGTIGFRIGG